MLTKLSLRNAKRSIKDYLIYLITMSGVAALMFAFDTMIFSKDIAKMARKLNPEIEIHEYSKNQEALEYAQENFKEGDIVLIKASNAMKLSEIAENLK